MLKEKSSWIQKTGEKQLKKQTFGDPQNVTKHREKVVKCSRYECYDLESNLSLPLHSYSQTIYEDCNHFSVHHAFLLRDHFTSAWTEVSHKVHLGLMRPTEIKMHVLFLFLLAFFWLFFGFFFFFMLQHLLSK